MKLIPIYIAVSLVASGCATSLTEKVAVGKAAVPVQVLTQKLPVVNTTRGSASHIEARVDLYRDTSVVHRAKSPWIGGVMTPATMVDALPSVFNDPYSLDFGNGRVSLAVVAARLTKMTGVPVRLRSDVYQRSSTTTPAAAPLPAKSPSGIPSVLPANFDSNAVNQSTSAVSSDATISVNAVNMQWNGKLRDFLDHLTSTLSLAWEYRDGTVVIMRMVTDTYEVASFPGQQRYSMSTGNTASGASGTGSGNNSSGSSGQAAMSVSQQGEVDARKSIFDSVKSMIAPVPGSTLTANDGTGRMVVTTSKEMQSQVRDYLRIENKMLRQMVNVTFDIYSVKTSDTDTVGIDWSLLYNSLQGGYGLTMKSPTSLSGTTSGSFGTKILSGRMTDSAAMLTMIRQFGESAQHRPISITTLNGQWDTKTRLSTDGYLKETTPGVASASGAAGAPGLKTDTITTGDQFAVLPQVMQDNNVMVKYAIGLSDLLGLFDVTTGTGATLQKVQTPRTDSFTANSTIILAPGDTAMITGLSRLVSTSDNNRLTEDSPLAFGGSRKMSVSREHFIVLVRATPL